MQIDLDPKDWRSDRERPYEPFFGSGAVPALAYLLSLTVIVTLLYYLR